jgi:hypothetical protein
MGRRGKTRTLATVAVVVAFVLALFVLMRWRMRPELALSRLAAAEAGAPAERTARGVDPTATGGIDGTVLDASGALRPGAAVAVRGDRVHRAVLVDPDGSFVVRRSSQTGI